MTETTCLPSFVQMDTFPFVGELKIKSVDAVPVREEPREGELGGGPCASCARPNEDYLWTDLRWRLGTPCEPSGFPFIGVLESRAHLDLDDLDDDTAADLGITLVRVNAAIAALPTVGRVHLTRFGDNRAHLHWMLYGRPVGLLHARGTFSAMWDQILTPQPRERWEDNRRAVAEALASWRGCCISSPD